MNAILRRGACLALLLVGLLLALPRVSSALPDESGATEFVLGSDDVIDINVRNHSDLNKTLTILPDGTISFPTLGEIQAAGKAPRALAAEIQAGLEKTLNNVFVTVSVQEIHSRRVRVLGAVKTPGILDLKRNWRLMDVVAAAGGLSAKPALVTGRIIRNGTKVIPLDLSHALARPDGEANVSLQPDDLVLLDEMEATHSQAHVLGQVNKPGAYDIDADTGLLSLLSLAGNPTDQAALTKAYVLRNGAHIPVNLRLLLVEGKADEKVTSFKVQPGDVLFVPENEERYAVMGQVSKPGYYPLPEKGEVTLLQAINLAGGQASNGDLSRAGIIRMVDGKATALPVNIQAMLKKANLSANQTLRSGDILYVPEHHARGFNWQDLLSPLSALSFFGFRFMR